MDCLRREGGFGGFGGGGGEGGATGRLIILQFEAPHNTGGIDTHGRW